jgi:hypothetical protein
LQWNEAKEETDKTDLDIHTTYEACFDEIEKFEQQNYHRMEAVSWLAKLRGGGGGMWMGEMLFFFFLRGSEDLADGRIGIRVAVQGSEGFP